jgi:hypothetical protein
MIDIGLYGALGFLVAALLALMLVPPLWKRAVRLTTKEIEATMPMSMADIQADKDQLRAEYAIELRRVEVALEKAKEKATRELVEANKRRVEIGELKSEIEASKARVEEKDNANRVLEQTIRRRLPEMESRLKAACEAIASLEAANAELRTTGASQAEALRMARSTMSVQRGDIDQLRGALEVEEAPSRRLFRSDSAMAKENRKLSAELSKLKEELVHGKIGGKENELLSQELEKLARQILVVAGERGVALPDAAPRLAAVLASAPEQSAAEALSEIPQRNGTGEPHAATGNGFGSDRIEPSFEPASHDSPASLAEPSDAAIAETERPQEQDQSARKSSSRRPSWRRRSLSERLKNVGAEASDA